MPQPLRRTARILLRLVPAAACAMSAAVSAVRAEEVAAPVADVLAVDRDFASRATDAGIRAAYDQYLAADAVLFRPLPVSGREWLVTHEPATGRLEWSPATAAVACDASFGVTFGTWSYTAKDSTVPDIGQYLTAWRQGEDGEWRIVLDQSLPVADPPLAAAAAGRGDCDEVADAGKRLAAADRKLNKSLRHLHAGPSAVPVQAMTKGSLLGSDRADLAVTHGELQERGARPGDEARTRAVYVRVWRRDGRAWHVLRDYLSPVTP